MKAREVGGYTAVQVEYGEKTNTNESKILVFINNSMIDFSPFKQLQLYRHLNIYEAYYESCAYSYILEFFVEDIRVTEFMSLFKNQNSAAELGLYKECQISKKSKKKTLIVKKVTI